jgi:hypothetical protein
MSEIEGLSGEVRRDLNAEGAKYIAKVTKKKLLCVLGENP